MWCHGTNSYPSGACQHPSGSFRFYAPPLFGCLRNYMLTTRIIQCASQTSVFSGKELSISDHCSFKIICLSRHIRGSQRISSMSLSLLVRTVTVWKDSMILQRILVEFVPIRMWYGKSTCNNDPRPSNWIFFGGQLDPEVQFEDR